MSGSPSSENKEANAWIKFFSTIGDLIVELIVRAAEGRYPFLNFFPLKQIFERLAFYLKRQGQAQINKEISEVVIGHQTEEQVEDYEAAKKNLASAIKHGSAADIEKASKEFDDAMEKLIHWDGSSNT